MTICMTKFGFIRQDIKKKREIECIQDDKANKITTL
jgi:hypothetical protein